MALVEVKDPGHIDELSALKREIRDPSQIAALDALLPKNPDDEHPAHKDLRTMFRDAARRQLAPQHEITRQVVPGALTGLQNIVRQMPETLGHYMPSAVTDRLPRTPEVPEIDMYKLFNAEKPSHWYTAQGLASGFGQYLPFQMAGLERKVGQAIGQIAPKLARESAPIKNFIARQLGTGAIFGGSQGYNAVESGIGQLAGASIGHAGGKAIGFMAGYKPVVQEMSNKVLDWLNKGAAEGESLPPERAAQNYAEYNGSQGEQLPVDVGTVTQHPNMTGLYSGIKEVPFSGAQKKSNIVNLGLAEKQNLEANQRYSANIAEAQRDYQFQKQRYQERREAFEDKRKQYEKGLMDYNARKQSYAHDSGKQQQDYATERAKYEHDQAQQDRIYAEQVAAHEQAQSAQDQDYAAQHNEYKAAQEQYQQHKQELEQQHADIEAKHLATQHLANRAPTEINQLLEAIPDKTEPGHYISEAIRDAYEPIRKHAKQKYKPLNESTLNLNEAHPNYTYPKYRNAASEINKERESLMAAFNTDSDMASSVRGEVEKATRFLKNSAEGKDTQLSAVITRIKNLGQAWASAKEAGHNNAARLLNNVRRALVDDTHELLEQSGHKDLAAKWDSANKFFKSNILPFWKTAGIRKVVGQGEIRAEHIAPGAKISSELFDPNNLTVLSKLPAKIKDVAYHQLLTGGKGTSKGLTTLAPENIASRVGSQQAYINKTYAAHNPEKMAYLENVSHVLRTAKDLSQEQKTIASSIAKLKEPIEPKEPKSLKEPKEPKPIKEPKEPKPLKEPIAPTAPRRVSIKEVSDARKALTEVNKTAKPVGIKPASEYETAIKKAKVVGKVGIGLGANIRSSLLKLALPIWRGSNVMQKILTNPELIQAYINKQKMPVNYDAISNALRTGLGQTRMLGKKDKRKK